MFKPIFCLVVCVIVCMVTKNIIDSFLTINFESISFMDFYK